VTPHVAVLIPSAGQRALANLARDAIAAFTQDVSHDVRLLDHAGARVGWPAAGSKAVGESLTQLGAALGLDTAAPPTHVFVMHDDALPLRAGWLAYLLSKPGPVTGVKLTEGTKMAHGSGVLFTMEAFLDANLRPDLPRRDAGEAPAAWCAETLCWRPQVGDDPKSRRRVLQNSGIAATSSELWWADYGCDVSFDDEWVPMYLHFGGGSLNSRPDTTAWIAAARTALDL